MAISVLIAALALGSYPVRATPAKQPLAAKLIVSAALRQAKEAATYDPSYVKLAYPGGDVPVDRGVCTDVVIRSLRAAGYDLQKLIREDMRSRFSKYPRRGKRPDPNIDHRRVPNQAAFFAAFGKTLTKSLALKDLPQWKPGDIVWWKFDNGIDHIGVVVDGKGPSGLPLCVHNLGPCALEDVLGRWRIIAHYRYPKD
ncbi:MAG: DUF1287 domain-containing protein [Fimbriimonadaceae bacterium]|nr:DUF1287 domain-containing protein [Fimbriimonadaceae bacterium]